jgi:predicted dinucleotide-binding enzyme
MIESIGVIGGGAWGTALALTAARAGRSVRLWARDRDTVAAIDERHENPRYLPGISLGHVPATDSLAVALRADAVILAVPAQATRAVATAAAPYLPAGTPLIVAAKGLEHDTGKRLSEVIAEVAPETRPAVLSGPSFAADVARGLPTAVTIAAEDEALALALCHALASPGFRPYAETDVTGVEIGGAVKNVLAIAAGIVAGRDLGPRAADRPRFRRVAPSRRGHGRPGRHADGALRPRRSGAHLHQPAVAQLLLRSASRPQRRPDRTACARRRHRHRRGCPRPRPPACGLDADHRRRCRHRRACVDRQRGHRGSHVAPAEARGGLISAGS